MRGGSTRGQTVVVLHDGRRIGALIAEARSEVRRGERTSDHGPGFRGARDSPAGEPSTTVRAFIDADRSVMHEMTSRTDCTDSS